MRRLVYGLILVLGIAGLIFSIKPILNWFTPFNVVTAEMKKELSSDCEEESENLFFGFGFYSESKASCWQGFKEIPLQCLTGTYCVYQKWYDEEQRKFEQGRAIKSPLWHEREAKFQ